MAGTVGDLIQFSDETWEKYQHNRQLLILAWATLSEILQNNPNLVDRERMVDTFARISEMAGMPPWGSGE